MGSGTTARSCRSTSCASCHPSRTWGWRYNTGAFARFSRNEPPLNEEELAEVERESQQVLDLGRLLADSYPDTVVGLVTDDEPEFLARP